MRELSLGRLTMVLVWQSDIIGQSWHPRGIFFGQQGMSSAMPSMTMSVDAISDAFAGAGVMAAAGRTIGAAMRPQTASTLRNRNMVSRMVTK